MLCSGGWDMLPAMYSALAESGDGVTTSGENTESESDSPPETGAVEMDGFCWTARGQCTPHTRRGDGVTLMCGFAIECTESLRDTSCGVGGATGAARLGEAADMACVCGVVVWVRAGRAAGRGLPERAQAGGDDEHQLDVARWWRGGVGGVWILR